MRVTNQRDVKESVTRLCCQLTEIHGLRCRMDDFEMGSGDLNESKYLIQLRKPVLYASLLIVFLITKE